MGPGEGQPTKHGPTSVRECFCNARMWKGHFQIEGQRGYRALSQPRAGSRHVCTKASKRCPQKGLLPSRSIPGLKLDTCHR